MSRNILIAFCGFKRSGKDTCAESIKKVLENDFKYAVNVEKLTIESFACHIKTIIKEIFGIDESDVEDKEKKIPFTKKYLGDEYSYRELLIKIGDGIRELINQNVWTFAKENKLHKSVKSVKNGDNVFVIPDVRYRSELKLLKKMRKQGWEVYFYPVFRKEVMPEWVTMGINPNVAWERNIIEEDFGTEYCEYEVMVSNPKVTDYIINDGTLEDLDKEVMEKVIKKIWKN